MGLRWSRSYRQPTKAANLAVYAGVASRRLGALFGIIWGLAPAGISYKLLAFGRFKKLSLGLCLAMGWMAVLAIEPLVQTLPPAGLALMGAGGLAYTVGVLFYVLQSCRFFHAVWHLFVMGGSACHDAAVLLFVLPSAPGT